MPSTPVKKFMLRYDGLFDFDGMYAMVIDWAKNYHYMWHEVSYKHKVPVPTGAEQEFDWQLTKEVTEFIHFTIKIGVHIWDMVDVEVDVDGDKKSLTSGRISIDITPVYGWDWQKKFSGSGFAEKLGAWYTGFVYKKEFESVYGDQIHYRAMNLHALFKKYFDMQSKKYEYKKYLGDN